MGLTEGVAIGPFDEQQVPRVQVGVKSPNGFAEIVQIALQT